MDTIKLLKEIEKKIKTAESYMPRLLEIFEQQGIKPTYRIKDKNRILEKVMWVSNNPNFQEMDEIEILNKVNDIIGLTVVTNTLEDAFTISDKIVNQLLGQSIKFKRCIDHISDNGGITDYKALLLLFGSEEGIPFEVQVTDNENLAIREATHKEFEKIKYGKVRASQGYKQRDIGDMSK